MIVSFVHLVLLGGFSVAASIIPRQEGKVATVDVVLPSNRDDDLFYNVNLNFNGQTLPVLLDTASADLMVASPQCSNTDQESGCYNMTKQYIIDNSTNILSNETFYTTVGLGTVLGNQSILTVGFGDLNVSDVATGLLYYAVKGQFQNGAFSGIWGIGMRNVSRQYYFNDRLPAIDTMIARNQLEKPVYSLSLQRYGDPDSPETGKLTLGGIEGKYANDDIAYNEILETPNYNYDGNPLAPQGWTAELQGIRFNNHELNLTRGLLVPSGKYVSLFDTGSQFVSFREDEFNTLITLFNGPTFLDLGANYAVYYECSRPQFLELKYGGQWYPINPLDMIIPSDHTTRNGTEYCRAPIGVWRRTFADSIIGVPFLRSAFSVYDYVSTNLYSVMPRVGLKSTVDVAKARARYPELYQSRLSAEMSTIKYFKFEARD